MVISFNPYKGLRNMKNHSQLTKGNDSLLKMVRILCREREGMKLCRSQFNAMSKNVIEVCISPS
jgi:hypothetical protein